MTTDRAFRLKRGIRAAYGAFERADGAWCCTANREFVLWPPTCRRTEHDAGQQGMARSDGTRARDRHGPEEDSFRHNWSARSPTDLHLRKPLLTFFVPLTAVSAIANAP